MKRHSIFSACFAYCLCILTSYGQSETIRLNIPIVEDTPNQHHFFHELLKTALEQSGFTPQFHLAIIPQLRIKHYLDSGNISVYWMIESEERNKKHIPIKVGLTNGLIGKRILFIKKGDQHLYDKVNNLDDFRNLDLVGGMGRNWFDVKVWQANRLKYQEASGNWAKIFKLISIGRIYNYFSRGINEILIESKKYPKLAIEQRLVLIYDRDFFFYLSKKGKNAGAKYEKAINSALKKAKSSGLIEKLVEKYWGDDFITLNYKKRVKLYLKTPNR